MLTVLAVLTVLVNDGLKVDFIKRLLALHLRIKSLFFNLYDVMKIVGGVKIHVEF